MANDQKTYKVVNGNQTYTLEDLVNDLMRQGWVPVGGVSYSEYLSTYSQAMVRKAPPKRGLNDMVDRLLRMAKGGQP